MIKEEFKAVHREEIDDFMSGIGVFEDYTKGNLHCMVCYEIINKNNFGAVKKENGMLIFYCNNHNQLK